ncbi:MULTISPECIES: hypothetical protein [unclassified Agarivorans]|uniref:hypothetical protein n=1 Tax=unclassified Agarivorans TaxID=2636026 RepID=UPI0026E21629|nr:MULTISPECIES: hypothetical protein [unclassified Agarivorans]MDO6686728.1 hypothetical protein [Agarivorans sp. 3_MG-2023]MDO6716542.1 hypothetical protein [Agarivorans sp. 2_MG-2023]
MRALVLLLGVLMVSACSQAPIEQHTYVLPYKAFGTPSMSGKLLGVEWFQWNAHGDSRPRAYPVNIVVYRGVALKNVEAAYPVNLEAEMDYRYVEYSDALIYFENNIVEVKGMAEEGYPMGRLAEQLEDTRSLIIHAFAN